MQTIIEGIILGLSIITPINPTNIEVIRRGLKEGWKSGFTFCTGVMVALIIYLLLVVFGVSFLTESEIFKIILSISGVIVLFYLAYSAAKDFFNKEDFDLSSEVDSKKHFIPGIVFTIFNPIFIVSWTRIIRTNLTATEETLQKGGLLSMGILIGILVFFIGLTALIYGGRRFITPKIFKYISLGMSLILLNFGLKFSYSLIILFGSV